MSASAVLHVVEHLFVGERSIIYIFQESFKHRMVDGLLKLIKNHIELYFSIAFFWDLSHTFFFFFWEKVFSTV